MRVVIHDHLCIGCGLCEELLPKTFIMQNQRARVKHVPESEEEKNHILQISEDCPAEAIEVILSENADGGS